MKKYVIVSLNHSTPKEVCFWRENNAGYTINPWQAGIYAEDEVSEDPNYYNNGLSTIAVCVTNSTFPDCGVNISLDPKAIKKYRSDNLGQI